MFKREVLENFENPYHFCTHSQLPFKQSHKFYICSSLAYVNNSTYNFSELNIADIVFYRISMYSTATLREGVGVGKYYRCSKQIVSCFFWVAANSE